MPSELTRLFVEWVYNDGTLAFRWVIDSPWVDLVACISGIVNDRMHLATVNSVDIGQEPVAQNVSLNSPGQGQLAVSLNVDKACFWLRYSTLGLLDGEGVLSLFWLRGSRTGRYREVQNADRRLESSDRLNCVTLALGGCSREVPSVEGVSETEDRAVTANLGMISNVSRKSIVGRSLR